MKTIVGWREIDYAKVEDEDFAIDDNKSAIEFLYDDQGPIQWGRGIPFHPGMSNYEFSHPFFKSFEWSAAKEKAEEENLGEVHCFEAEPSIAILLEETAVKYSPVRLPFKHLFLDCRLTLGSLQYYGFSAFEMPYAELEGVDETRFPQIAITAFYWDTSIYRAGSILFLLPWIHTRTGISLSLRRQIRFLTRCLMNFVYMLDMPEVKLINWEPKESSERKRIAKGLPQRLPTTRVRLRGELRIYLNRLLEGGRQLYSHAFWVRGHWRHFHSPKFTNLQGQKRWIPPYIKGEGVLVPKIYEIDPVWARDLR